MSNARYIEIDSTYRNRKEWPSPAEFEVLIAQSGRKDRFNAQDPVSYAARLNNFYWDSNTFIKGATGSTGATISVTASTLLPGIVCSGDNKTIIQVTSTPNTLQQQENYYAGAILTDGIDSARIASYVFLGNNRAQITVQGSIKITNYTLQISDPSDTSDPTNTFIFVPDGRIGLNSYTGHILYNETNSTYSDILNYDPITKLFKVSDVSGKNWNVSQHQRFSIRKQIPIVGTFNNLLGEQSNLVFSLPSTFTDEPDSYRNSYIFIDNQTRLITRYETLTGKAVNGTVSSINFPEGASNINGYYNGAYVQIKSGNANTNVRQIINYTVSGIAPNLVRTATVATPFSGSGVAQGDLFTFRSIFVESEFTVSDFSKFEILLFSHDNHNPFVYTGSLQQEILCYQIELLNVILPNKILNCGLGSRIAYYPYVYIELTNISGSSAGMKNAIYSNNPNATRMVFRAPIYDVQNPNNSAFVNLDGDGMVQTLKFKPNDNLFFSVHLSNGELYRTLENETYGPLIPNPEIQISASFSFKRVDK